MKQKVIVANTGEDSISIIDLKKSYENELIPIKSLLKKEDNLNIYLDRYNLGPYDLCINSEESKIYLTNVYDNSVFKIDINDMRIEDIIAVGRFPSCIKIYNGFVIVTNSDSNSISIIDERNFKLIENISVGEKPGDIKIDEISKKIYIVNNNGYSIDIIDLNNDNIDKIKLDKNPIKICLEKGFMYVLSHFNNGVLNCSNISIMNMTDFSIINSMDIKGIFNDIIKVGEKDLVFVTSLEDGHLYKIDLSNNKIISKNYLEGMPNKVLFYENSILLITNISKGYLTVFDITKNKIIKNIKVGLEPNSLAIY